MPSWAERQDDITLLAQRQLFFIGGAPRSGTTWLQQILDAHPDISCRGEGFFMQQLATPLQNMMAQRRAMIEAKNRTLFRHTGGYPLPHAEDVEALLGTAILLALQRQAAGKPCRAIGEKTPENVFLFARLKALFPRAKFIGMARDPRDVLTSAWHLFRRAEPDEDPEAAKLAFIRSALPSMAEGTRIMLDLVTRYPGDCMVLTYEALQARPELMVAALFRFLGVGHAAECVQACVAQNSFAATTGGRAAGVELNGAFLRKGVVGDWPSTLSPDMNALVLQELGWMFPIFGWQA